MNGEVRVVDDIPGKVRRESEKISESFEVSECPDIEEAVEAINTEIASGQLEFERSDQIMPEDLLKEVDFSELLSGEEGETEGKEISPKQKKFMKALLKLPFIGEKQMPALSGFDKVLSKTLEYYLSLPIPMRKKIERSLEGQLLHFDPNEMENISDGKKFLNVKLVKRLISKKDFFGAYEAFWGTWNPGPHKAAKTVYGVAGGDKNPVRSTMTSFAYSGLFLHALNPVMYPIYMATIATGHADTMPTTMAGITGAYIVMGIPVAVKKALRKNNSENISKPTS